MPSKEELYKEIRDQVIAVCQDDKQPVQSNSKFPGYCRKALPAKLGYVGEKYEPFTLVFGDLWKSGVLKFDEVNMRIVIDNKKLSITAQTSRAVTV